MLLTGPRRIVLIYALVHTFIFICVFGVLAQLFYYSPGILERFYSLRILNGMVPYRDFPIEYPPLGLLAFLLPALATDSQLSYNVLFFVELLLFDLVIILVIARLAARSGLEVGGALLIYTVLILAVGPIAIARYDLLPAMLTMIALLAFLKSKNKTAWVFLALGTVAKLYPVLIGPLFAVYHLAKRQYRQLVEGCLVFGATTALFVVPFILLHASNIKYILGYHIDRGLHSESAFGTLILLGQLIGITHAEGAMTFGSWNLVSTLADQLAKASFYISAGLLLLIYGWFAGLLIKKGKRTIDEDGTLLLRFTFLAILVFLLTNKVFSSQYLIWLCPLLPLIMEKRNNSLWFLFTLAAALTQYIFPYAYRDFERFKTLPVIIMGMRNLILVALAIGVILLVRRQQGVPESGGTHDNRNTVP